MEEGRFSPLQMDYFKITMEDFEKAIEKFNPNPNKRRPIGYKLD